MDEEVVEHTDQQEHAADFRAGGDAAAVHDLEAGTRFAGAGRAGDERDASAVFVLAGAVMFATAWLIERLVLRHLVNQEGAPLLMATLGLFGCASTSGA